MKLQNKRPFIRRLLLTLLILLTSVLQNAFLGAVKPGILLLIPLVVCISMYEREFAAFFFGILCGALWDLTSPLPDGLYALCFALLAFASGLLAKRVFRNTPAAAMLLCFLFASAVNLIAVVYALLSAGFSGILSSVVRTYLPSALLTTVFCPLFYFLVRSIERLLHTGVGTPE